MTEETTTTPPPAEDKTVETTAATAPKAKAKSGPEPEGLADPSTGAVRSTLPIPNPAPVK